MKIKEALGEVIASAFRIEKSGVKLDIFPVKTNRTTKKIHAEYKSKLPLKHWMVIAFYPKNLSELKIIMEQIIHIYSSGIKFEIDTDFKSRKKKIKWFLCNHFRIDNSNPCNHSNN